MKILPVISSVLIIMGCFLPWLPLGSILNRERGIDNIYGAIMLVAGVIAGGIAFYNQSEKQPKETWLYLVIGILGFVVFYLYLKEKLPMEIKETVSFFNGDKNGNVVSMMKFIGTGLYIIFTGSIGLIISSFGVFKEDTKATEKTLSEKLSNVTSPKYKKVDNKTEEEIENERYRHQLRLLNQAISVKHMNNIFQLLEVLCQTQDDAIYLLKTYHEIFKKDLIGDLKKINNSYEAIKNNLSKFIELDILEEGFPHYPKKRNS